eukprot:3148643-Karenia_brevis.AAC.1
MVTCAFGPMHPLQNRDANTVPPVVDGGRISTHLAHFVNGRNEIMPASSVGAKGQITPVSVGRLPCPCPCQSHR